MKMRIHILYISFHHVCREEIEKENYDPKRYYTAAALTTVLTRLFGIRPPSHTIDRCPTFVSKEKSFRTKFIGKYSRKVC
jgi:Rho guanine nucleotide exchange factor 12